MYLTPFIKQIMDEYLHKKIINLDYDIKLNILLYKLSTILGCFRVKYEGQIINYYGICFAPSGYGKDFTSKSINEKLFKDFIPHYNTLMQDDENNARRRLEEEAFDLFKPDIKGNTDKNEKRRNEWLYENEKRIRQIPYEVNLSKDSTSQGIIAETNALSRYSCGSLNIQVSELSFYVKSMKSEDHTILQHLSDLYEGEIKPYLIKSEAKKIQVKGVVCNSLMFCDPRILLDPREKGKFLAYMQTSLARRSFLTYQFSKKAQWGDYSETRILDEYCLKHLTPRINKVVEILEKSSRQIIFSDAAIQVYNEYGIKNTQNYNSISRFTSDVALNEMLDRPYRARKLACIIAAVEHPESLIVTEEDMYSAISITAQFGGHLEQFIEATPQDEGDKLYFFFQKSKGKWFTRSNLRDMKFVPKDSFKLWFDAEIESIQNKALEDGYKLLTEKFDKNGYRYMLVDKGQESLTLLQGKISQMDKTVYYPENIDVKFSHSKNMTQDYKPYAGKFSGISSILTEREMHYSAGQFKNGYRNNNNFFGEPSLIILDIDEGLTLDEAQNTFKPFLNCISTSRNHQKEKNGKVNDRFRVILPTYPIPEEYYTDVMTSIINYFKSDEKCKDKARFYFSNPDALTYFNEGILFDWRPFLSEKDVAADNTYTCEMSLEDFCGRNFSNVIGSSKADELYEKSGIYFTIGNRNSSFFRLCAWMKDLVAQGELTEDSAIEELWRIYSSIDTADFPESELEKIINNAFYS